MPPPSDSLKKEFEAFEKRPITAPSREALFTDSGRSLKKEFSLFERAPLSSKRDIKIGPPLGFVKEFTTTAAEAIPGIAAAGGFALGAPVGLGIPGGLAGGSLGVEGANLLRGVSPELFGQQRPVVPDILEESATSFLGLGLDKAADIPFIRKMLKEGSAAVQQRGGELINNILENLKNVNIPKAPRQAGEIAKDFTARALRTFKARKARVDRKFLNFKKARQADRVSFKLSGGGIKEIESPINLTAIQPRLQKLKAEAIAIRDDKFTAPDTKEAYNSIVVNLNKLTDSLKTDKGELFEVPFESIKEFRTSVRKNTFGKKLNRPAGQEVRISQLLDEAVRNTFQKRNPRLNLLRDESSIAFGELENQFPQEIRNIIQGVKGIGGKALPRNMEQVIRSSFSSAEGTQDLLDLVGGSRVLAREAFWTQTLAEHLNENGVRNLGALRIALEKSKQVGGAAVLFSDKMFKSLNNFIEKAAKELPFATGKSALQYQGDRFVLFGTFGALKAAFKGNLTEAVGSLAAGQGSKIAMEIGPENFAKLLLLRPQNADVLKGLLTGNPANKNVSRAIKLLLGTKGLAVTYKVFDRKSQEWKTAGEDIVQNPEREQFSFSPSRGGFLGP